MQERDSAWNSVHAHLEDARTRAHARLWDRLAYPADFGKCTTGRGRVALSGPAAHVDQGLGYGRMAPVGEQPAGALLPADGGGTETVRSRGLGVRARDASDHPGDPTGLKRE